MNLARNIVFGLFFSLGLTSFIKGVEPDQYLKLFQQNRSKFEKTSRKSRIIFDVLYLSPDLQKAMKAKSHGVEEFSKFEKTLKNSIDFSLKVSIPSNGQQEFLKSNSKVEMSYEKKLLYYSFDLQKDIYLVVDKSDTLKCASYNYERTFDVSPHGNILLGFKYDKKFSELKLLIHERCFEMDTFSFQFNIKEIQSLGKLKSYKKW